MPRNQDPCPGRGSRRRRGGSRPVDRTTWLRERRAAVRPVRRSSRHLRRPPLSDDYPYGIHRPPPRDHAARRPHLDAPCGTGQYVGRKRSKRPGPRTANAGHQRCVARLSRATSPATTTTPPRASPGLACGRTADDRRGDDRPGRGLGVLAHPRPDTRALGSTRRRDTSAGVAAERQVRPSRSRSTDVSIRR